MIKQLLIYCLPILSFLTSNGQKSKILNLSHGYSFEVDRAIWKEADDAKKTRKMVQDSRLIGMKVNYDYVFSLDNDEHLTIPFFVVMPIPTRYNYYEETKRNGLLNDENKIFENFEKFKRYLSDVSFDANSYLFDDEKKTITSINHIKRLDGAHVTNMTVILFKQNYMIQFTFTGSTKNFEYTYFAFDEIANSVKLY